MLRGRAQIDEISVMVEWQNGPGEGTVLSNLRRGLRPLHGVLAMLLHMPHMVARLVRGHVPAVLLVHRDAMKTMPLGIVLGLLDCYDLGLRRGRSRGLRRFGLGDGFGRCLHGKGRSEEHTPELQSQS